VGLLSASISASRAARPATPLFDLVHTVGF